MVPALDLTRLPAPDIAGAAGDAGEAADAASFASLLDAHGFDACASEAAALLPQFSLRTPPNAEGGDDDPDSTGAASDDDPSRVNEAAFLVLTVAFPQPTDPPAAPPRGDAAESPQRARPEPDGRGSAEVGFVDPPAASQADSLFDRRRHLRLVTSDRADAPPVAETPPAADAAATGALHRSIDDRAREFAARVTRSSRAQAPQGQIPEAGEALPGEAPSAAPGQQSLDAAATVARRAVDAAWSAQVAQDRSAIRDASDHAGPGTIGEPGLPRISAAVSSGNETFAGGQGEGGGNADAGGNAPGSPFAQTRSASPSVGLRPLHTLVPVAFEVARDNGALSAATTASSSALPNEDGVSTSIVQALRLQVTAGGGSATITLDPSYLGGVRVAVQVANGAVTATLHAANPQVRAWMDANESTLRQSLLDQGLTLDRLIVAEDHGADLQRDSNPQDETPHDRPQPRPRRPDSDERFEVIV